MVAPNDVFTMSRLAASPSFSLGTLVEFDSGTIAPSTWVTGPKVRQPPRAFCCTSAKVMQDMQRELESTHTYSSKAAANQGKAST